MWNKLCEGHIDIYIYNRMMRQYLKKTRYYLQTIYTSKHERYLYSPVSLCEISYGKDT